MVKQWMMSLLVAGSVTVCCQSPAQAQDGDKQMTKDQQMMKNKQMMKDGQMTNDKQMMKDNQMMGDRPMTDTPGTVVDVAAKNGSFKTLVAAVKAAGLVETLSGEGPFTIFAPTDAAFAALPKGTVENLLKPENKAQLAKILTYHVVSGKALASDIQPGAIKTVEGKNINITTRGQSVKVNNANVVTTDVEASNGVIHVIDKVLMP